MPPIRVDLTEFGSILQPFRDIKVISDDTGQRVVLRATHADWGTVAIKVANSCNDGMIERFKREVDVLCQIQSPYYPRQYEFHVTPAKGVCTVEEFVEGESLLTCMDRFADCQAARALVLELCRGLSEIWKRNVVHRDIKPGNIIIATGSQAKIIDLGIARFLSETSLTHPAAAHGPCTPNYAAPEQLTNRKIDIDWRTDQFTLGILLGQLVLNGQHPFDPNVVGVGGAIYENILTGHWARQAIASLTDAETHAVISKMLGTQPYERFRRPADLTASLQG